MLYVAMTRAQALLYLTHTKRRLRAGRFKDVYLSSFIKDLNPKEVPWEAGRPAITVESRVVTASILERDQVDDAQIRATMKVL